MNQIEPFKAVNGALNYVPGTRGKGGHGKFGNAAFRPPSPIQQKDY